MMKREQGEGRTGIRNKEVKYEAQKCKRRRKRSKMIKERRRKEVKYEKTKTKGRERNKYEGKE